MGAPNSLLRTYRDPAWLHQAAVCNAHSRKPISNANKSLISWPTSGYSLSGFNHPEQAIAGAREMLAKQGGDERLTTPTPWLAGRRPPCDRPLEVERRMMT